MSRLDSLIQDSQESEFMRYQSSGRDERDGLSDPELQQVLLASQASYQHEQLMRSDYYLKYFLEQSIRDAISANDKLNEHLPDSEEENLRNHYIKLGLIQSWIAKLNEEEKYLQESIQQLLPS